MFKRLFQSLGFWKSRINRTLRGWTKIREEWRKLAEKGKTNSDELWKVVKGYSIEDCIKRYDQSSQKDRDAVIDAYLQKDFSGNPVKQLAQEAHRLWRTGQKLQALEFFNRAVDQTPDDAILLLNRANLHTELGNVNEALHDFERARAGHPRLPEQLFGNQEGLQNMSPAGIEYFIQRRKDAR